MTDVAALVEENTVAYWRVCAPLLPGGSFHEDGDLTWFTTGFTAAPWFNQVLQTRCDPVAAEARIDETLAFFRERGLPMLWSASASDSPADLAGRLQRRGLVQGGGVLTGMARDLDALPDAELPSGLTIERVHDEQALGRWLRAYVVGFGMREEQARPFHDLYRATGLDDGAPFRHYVGSLDGRPVASSTVFLGVGTASIWHVGALPEARRQGIGSAMTLAPLRDARELGLRTGVLASSEAGLSVYRKLGFQTYARIVQYRWGRET